MGSMEHMKGRSEQAAELPLFDNRAQIALARFAYRHEHPDVAAPSSNDIMTEWVNKYAAEYRKVAEEHPDATLDPNDELALEEYYGEIASHHSGDATLH